MEGREGITHPRRGHVRVSDRRLVHRVFRIHRHLQVEAQEAEREREMERERERWMRERGMREMDEREMG
jgi:hypothetical protein